MMDQPANRKELLNVFSAVAAEFAGTRKDIEQRERLLRRCLESLENARRAPLVDADATHAPDFVLQMAQQCKSGIDQTLKGWLTDIEQYDRNTSFRKDFEDSLLIFVYGKVKSGKSSLGNYLAYGHTAPNAQQLDEADPMPEFFWHVGNAHTTEHMSAERMKQQRCFGVDVVEATSSIQGFRLPGLTWVDSPGVHSANADNGQLASDYAACADLIVFLSNSSSPGRRSDMGEISRLLDQGKELMVMITGSDNVEPDVDDHGNIVQVRLMKSAEDRADQIAHMGEQLQGLEPAPAQMQVHSISTRYAEDGAPGEQAQRWQESGMAGFASDIARLARSSGLTMKRQAPLKNLQAFFTRVVASIKTLQLSLTNMGTELADARGDLKVKAEHLVATLNQQLAPEINRLAKEHAMQDDKFAAACRALFDKLFNYHATELCGSIGQHFDSVQLDKQAVGFVLPDITAFTMRKEKVSFESKRSEGVGRAGGAALGGWGGAEAGAILGSMIFPGVGTVVGGLLGGIAGGWLGNKGGGTAGGLFNSTEELEIEVGDNRDEVSLAARERLIELARHRVQALYQQLDQLCYGAVTDWLRGFSRELEATRKQAMLQINEIEQELAHGIA